MSGSLNKVQLIGRLGADPEIKQMVNGKNVARLSIATSQSWKDKSLSLIHIWRCRPTEVVLQGFNSSLTMLGGNNQSMKTSENNQDKSSLPNDQISQENSDLDDEIPF